MVFVIVTVQQLGKRNIFCTNVDKTLSTVQDSAITYQLVLLILSHFVVKLVTLVNLCIVSISVVFIHLCNSWIHQLVLLLHSIKQSRIPIILYYQMASLSPSLSIVFVIYKLSSTCSHFHSYSQVWQIFKMFALKLQEKYALQKIMN